MRLFFLLIRSSWVIGLMSLVLGAVSGMATLGLITLIHEALSKPTTESLRLPMLFTLACIAVMATQVSSKCLLVRLSQSTAARLRYELCQQIMASPLARLEAVGPHRLLATLIDDVNAITAALCGLPGVCASAMVLTCGLGYLASLSAALACGTVLMASIGVASYLAGIRFANKYLRQAREDQDEVFRQLRAMICGIKELKGNNSRCVDFTYDVLLPADTKMRHRMITGLSIQGFTHSWGRLYLFIGIGLLIFVWPKLWTVAPGTLMGYTLTILYLTYPLDSILGWLPAMSGASISLSKIETLGLLIDDSDEQHIDMRPPRFVSLELQGVTYRYSSPDGKGFSLGPIDLSLSAQEVLFVAGGNGSGKTTLAKLLTGLYVPDEGRVLLNGRTVSNLSRGNYRQLFSTVFVEGHLFDRLLGVDTDPVQVSHWSKLLGIQEKIDIQTGRLLTDQLSRGQHKRLALLVACLDDRSIFVFDEWAAEQDPGFKEVFYRQIVPELRRRGRTVVAITHDDRYFFAADRVLTLSDGHLRSAAKRNVA